MQYKGKKNSSITIKTKTAELTIKSAANEKDQDLYTRIKDEDLLAKEFKYHEHCYKNFTRQPTATSHKQIYEKRNFTPVQTFINEEVIKNGNIVPMDKL